ncbi:GlxA family transcriptional regulator [Streptomyces sp. NPDC020983]|uniref:GlxA family transcriptional regulator n=1 Tax=Streptomyces sp. NPDC020983 TaxID=3365106 RepID=UPI0037A1C9CC
MTNGRPGFIRVAAYAPQGVTTLALGIVAGVFGQRLGTPPFETRICTDLPGPVRTDLGVAIPVEHGLEALSWAELVLLLPGDGFRDEPSAQLLDELRASCGRGVTVAAHCTGVFTLAASGLLDGLDATTHWQFCDALSSRRPAVRVRPEALYIDHGLVATGAGATAGLDLCLHLVRRDHGATIANTIARGLVSPPQRHGGQAQFVSAPVPQDVDDRRLADAVDWARTNLHQRLSVPALAARALMSPRTFARRFKALTGTTPHAWIVMQRLERAERLLESTDMPIQEIARHVGYGSAAVFRAQFAQRRGVPPGTYRTTFTVKP